MVPRQADSERSSLADAGASVDWPYWSASCDEVIVRMSSDLDGLTADDAAARLALHGPNRLAPGRRTGPLPELSRQFAQPVVLILIAATGVAAIVGDRVDAFIIFAIVLLSALLGFWQEHRAAVTVTRLLGQVRIEVEVRRSGALVSVPPEGVVPGDVLVLNAGDIVPCDCRVLTAESLQLDESALTGETYPRHKRPDPAPVDAPLTQRHSVLFQGTHVVSGQGRVLAVDTGAATELGRVARTLAVVSSPTSFEQGSRRLGLLLARVTGVVTTVIFLLNVGLDRPLVEALLFSLALAVGVTPQMLPAIVAVSLSSGARRLAREKVIVRRLDAIEDLGAMDVLCTDKTGTLTLGSITLAASVDVTGRPSDLVAERAATNAGLQTGFTNPLDDAILVRLRPDPAWRAIAEVPFDFERKRLSVLAGGPVDGPDDGVLITKGAVSSVLAVCTQVLTSRGARPLSEYDAQVDELFRQLSTDGYRVLAVAERGLPDRTSVAVADEKDMTLLGLLAFDDPLKEGLRETVGTLRDLGVRLCMVTGDNHLAATHVARAVGLGEPVVLTGADVDALDDADLSRASSTVAVFAELNPVQKERVIEAIRSSGSIVGYLGDGINDAGSLHLADVGISVDTAVDVARSAAALVLLDKDLRVVVEGVRLGRQTFVNTLKYIYTTVSANFGNTASMAAASAFLPFLPLLPRQILLLNFLTDLPSVSIAADRVDDEDVAGPRHWDIHAVRNFMVVFGLLSSGFDLATFAVLLRVFDAGAGLFQTGWFVGSALTELAVLLVLRTRRPAFRSRPGRTLLVSSILVATVVAALPYLPAVAGRLGLIPLPGRVFLTLLGITAAYVAAAEVTKRFYYRSTPAGFTTAAVTAARVPPRHRRLSSLAHEHGREHPASDLHRPWRR